MSSRESSLLQREEVEHRTPPGADLLYYPCFLRGDEADRCFAILAGDACVRWRQDHIQLYGRRIALPRLTAWYGEPGLRYVYSGIVNETEPWDETLRGLARRAGEAAGTRFNAVLLNLYRDGRDAVSWHSDAEAELGPEPVIASLSLGAERAFQLRHKDHGRNGIPWEELRLRSGSLLVMRGSTQRLWQHRLPRQAGACGPRINLSFRRIDASPRPAGAGLEHHCVNCSSYRELHFPAGGEGGDLSTTGSMRAKCRKCVAVFPFGGLSCIGALLR